MRLLFIFWFCCGLALAQQEEGVPWSDSFKFTWDDFKASPNYQSDAVAITASGITFGYSVSTSNGNVIDFSTEIFAHFYPEQSWVKPEEQTDYILAHEQYHFNITELHARKFRQRVAQLKPHNTIKATLDRIHQDINTALRAMQKRYDAETDHSRNQVEQAQWEAYIAAELKATEAYKK